MMLISVPSHLYSAHGFTRWKVYISIEDDIVGQDTSVYESGFH